MTGLAFDRDGNLWVFRGGGIIEKYASSSLGAPQSPVSGLAYLLSRHTLVWSGAFSPVPAGLPLH